MTDEKNTKKSPTIKKALDTFGASSVDAGTGEPLSDPGQFDAAQTLSVPPVQSETNPLPPTVSTENTLPKGKTTKQGAGFLKEAPGHAQTGHYPDPRFRIAVDDDAGPNRAEEAE